MKILALDIETSPHLGYFWGLHRQNIGVNQIVEPSRMMCVAASWLDESKVHFWSEHEHSREDMLGGVWELLNEAHAVLHYNGKSFDMPTINREFLEGGMQPPAPYQQIDLLATARKQFRFASNKLAHVSERLGVGGKESTGGFDLWLACMGGSDKAWKKMRKYNIQDVRLLKDAYYMLRPWIVRHPNVALVNGQMMACTKCGSEDLQMRGWKYTGAGQFRQTRCNHCGGWDRFAARDRTTGLRDSPLN